MADINFDIKDLMEEGVNESSGLISRREYNMSIVKSRQAAESLVKAYASEKGVEYTTFADTIEALFQNGIINRTSRDALHNIRVYGNKAVREGDNDSEDAQKALYLLKNEVSTFLSRKTVSTDRTPVRIDSPSSTRSAARHVSREIRAGEAAARERMEKDEESRQIRDQELDVDVSSLLRNNRGAETQRSGYDSEHSERRTRTVSAKSSSRNANRSSRSGRETERSSRNTERSTRRGSSTQRRSSRDEGRSAVAGISIYDILRILIPVVAVILVIIIIRSLIPTGGKTNETTTVVAESVIEETSVQETVPPTTEAETEPPVYEYKIKGDGVNVRFADNQNRVYTQLSNGTAIGTVEEIEGSDFVAFTLDGVNVVVRKDFIEPIS